MGGALYGNILFGLGLTPLGIQSALAERYLIGRGTALSNGSYPTPSGVMLGETSAAPAAAPVISGGGYYSVPSGQARAAAVPVTRYGGTYGTMPSAGDWER